MGLIGQMYQEIRNRCHSPVSRDQIWRSCAPHLHCSHSFHWWRCLLINCSKGSHCPFVRRPGTLDPLQVSLSGMPVTQTIPQSLLLAGGISERASRRIPCMYFSMHTAFPLVSSSSQGLTRPPSHHRYLPSDSPCALSACLRRYAEPLSPMTTPTP